MVVWYLFDYDVKLYQHMGNLSLIYYDVSM
jgi:hypothetical protein